MDKVHKRGYMRIGFVVGGLTLLAIMIPGTIRAMGTVTAIVNGGVVSTPGVVESIAMVAWAVAAGWIIYLIIRLMIRVIDRWAQLLGGGG